MTALAFKLKKLEELIDLAMAAGNEFERAAVFTAAELTVQDVAQRVQAARCNWVVIEKLGEVTQQIAQLTGFAPSGTSRHGDAHQAHAALSTVRLNLHAQL